MDAQLHTLAKKLVETLKSRSISLAAAESCTGGAIASAAVSISGASSVFKGSAVCYCDAAKNSLLGVRNETLEKFFAESPQCAAEMALGARKIFKADIAVASTGFLDANTPAEKAALAGRVFVALAPPSAGPIVEEISLDPLAERNANRLICAKRALELILNFLETSTPARK